MGFNLFCFLSGFGFKLSLYQRSDPEALLRKHQRRLSRQLKNGIISESMYQELVRGQQVSSDFTIIAQADLVIECLTEDLQTKNHFFREADHIVSPGTLFASNSSSFIPSEFDVSAYPHIGL
jgi:3-hydroxyacyl-CoA dehydrogenase